MKHINKCNIKKKAFTVCLCGALFLTGCGGGASGTATGTDAEHGGTAGDASVSQNGQSADVDAVADADGFYPADDYIKTVADTVNVRLQPDTDSSIYKLLAAGEVVKRTGYNDEWARVDIDGGSFYIYAEYVEVTDAPADVEEETASTETSEDENEDAKPKTIVIDPGNQLSMNASTEQIGPGSEDTKMGATTGVVGIAQGTEEYSLNLTYALALKQELEERGYTVTLTRESNDVNITNKERAEIANASGAEAFIRIKMNYSTNDALTGIMAVTMSESSPYNSELYDESQKLATRLLQGLTESTGATNHGIYESDSMTAVNWSSIPVAVIELGYLSNEEDESKLLDVSYQSEVIKGLADGIDLYYN
jgi:N-acetylmuramoyl-L-alanine amidase